MAKRGPAGVSRAQRLDQEFGGVPKTFSTSRAAEYFMKRSKTSASLAVFPRISLITRRTFRGDILIHFA